MKPMGLDEEKFWSLIYAIFFGAIVGGKLFVRGGGNGGRLSAGELSFFRDFRSRLRLLRGLPGGRWGRAPSPRACPGLRFLATADYFGAALPLGQNCTVWPLGVPGRGLLLRRAYDDALGGRAGGAIPRA